MNTTPSSRIALVTGAAGGLGRAFALRLAAGGQALALACDLADTADVRRFAAEVLTLAGRIEVLVNNAAFMPMVPLATLSAALWRQIMTVNVDAPFLLAQAFSVGMAERRWGRIVNLVSSTVWSPPPGMSAYACQQDGRDRPDARWPSWCLTTRRSTPAR